MKEGGERKGRAMVKEREICVGKGKPDGGLAKATLRK